MNTNVFPQLEPQAIRQLLASGKEVALIDIREVGEYGQGHALLAVNLPWSLLEIRAVATLPRLDVQLIIQDDDGGVRAHRAAARLQELGYSNVWLASGGVQAWQPLFKGVNVPSKAFSEWIEREAHTPTISAATLSQWQRSAKPHWLLDGRTPEEFRQFHIPGAINVPNGELSSWLSQQRIPTDEPVVITCAGRTRGIIGAQALRDTGFPHHIVALAGGTQSWRIDELPVKSDSNHHFLAKPAVESANGLTNEAIPVIDPETLLQWQVDAYRTTYVFDVRSREEFEQGSVKDAVWVPAGQLIQTLDEYASIRNARLVLFDPHQARARFSGWFLHQLGWQVSLLFEHPLVANSSQHPALELLFAGVNTLNAKTARALPNATLLSADPSKLFLKQRIASAHWVNRSTLKGWGNSGQPLLIYAHDPALAFAVAWELRQQPSVEVYVVTGDVEAWQAAGWELDITPGKLEEAERVDFLFWLHDRHSGNLQSSRDYLAWEASLPDAVDADGLHGFRRLEVSQHQVVS